MGIEQLDWAQLLADQLDWHWRAQARPRLDGLTDDEYFWEPAPGAWSVRPRAAGVALEIGAGDFVIDFAFPEPTPAPVTTIAWRLGHIIVGVLGDRNARYFGGEEISYQTYHYPSTAAAALEEVDRHYARWIDGVGALDADRLAAACREPGYDTDPMARLVLHIHREMIHHLAEVALLRDLYAHTVAPSPPG